MSRQPVRVLYCESNVDGSVGGSHSCLLNLVGSLDRERYQPIVVFYEAHSLLDRFQQVATTMVLPQDRPVRWGERGRIPTAIPAIAARRAINAIGVVQSITGKTAFIRKHGIGLVHLNNSLTRHHEWMCAARLARVPCIVHERGLPKYGPSDRFWSRRLPLIVPMSRWIGRAMVEQGVAAGRIRVMYDGVDPERLTVERSPEQLRQHLGIRPGQPVIGIVGNIREWKGQETVVRALRPVVDRHPDLVCLFVGAAVAVDQQFKQRLDGLIMEIGLLDNIRFTGYQRDVPSFVNLMRFMIHASTVPEPFGMVVLEAMALKKAVIGSRAGGVIEMVTDGETGFTTPAGDAPALAARMLDLLADESRTTEMGRRGHRRVVEHFSLRRYANDVQASYDAIQAGRPVTTGDPIDAASAPSGGGS